MYVRWEHQEKPKDKRRGNGLLTATIVDGNPSEDIKNLRIVCQLGSIQERFLTIRISKTKAFHQGLFWVKADKRLNELGLPPAARHAIEKQISEKIARPSEDWALWGVTCIPHIDS